MAMYVDVEIASQPMFTRLCKETKRLLSTIIDDIVIVISILTTIAYSLSVMCAKRLTKIFMHKIISSNNQLYHNNNGLSPILHWHHKFIHTLHGAMQLARE